MAVIMLTNPVLEAEYGFRVAGLKCGFIGGSRAIVIPPPTDTDLDMVFHVDNLQYAVEMLLVRGFSTTKGEYLDDNTFTKMRRGELNLMLFEDAYEFGAVWGATSYAQSYNLRSKPVRYDLFERIRIPWRGEDSVVTWPKKS